MTDPAAKRLKMDMDAAAAPVLLATHNGHFHADEALAVHLLRRHVPTYAAAELVRTRDPARLAAAHTVVDVGGVYDADLRRFDHHQRGFDTTFPTRATKLSSAGLVYLHFGREIVVRRIAAWKQANPAIPAEEAAVTEADIDKLFVRLYTSFVEALDAHDNGIDPYDPTVLATANDGQGVSKRFSDSNFTLGAVVRRYNAQWNDAQAEAEGQAGEDSRFEQASARIGAEFDRELDYLVTGWLPARGIVRAAFAARRAFDSQGRVLIFRGQSCPWKDHLYAEEAEEAKELAGAETPASEAVRQAQEAEKADIAKTEQSTTVDEVEMAEAAAEIEAGKEAAARTEAAAQRARVLYVLYPDKQNSWRVQCVPGAKDSFDSRKPLPEAWRGHRDGELDAILGDDTPDGAVFVHAAGFIGGHRTFEGALSMAKRALEL